MKLIFEADDDEGNAQELVLERDLRTGTASEESGEGTSSVQEAANTLLEHSLNELERNGLELPENQRPYLLIEMALAILNERDEVRLPARFTSSEGEARERQEDAIEPEDEEEPSVEDSDEEVP